MALPSWDTKMRRNNLYRGLADGDRQVQADMRTYLIRRPARDIIPLRRCPFRLPQPRTGRAAGTTGGTMN